MKFTCSLIVVTDIERSTQFYRDLLGQKVKFDFGANVTFEGDFAIHLQSHFVELLGETHPKPVQKTHNFELYFESDELEAMYSKLVQGDITFLHPVMEQPWKQKVMRFYDPDGHIIEVGETLESVVRRLAKDGLSVEQIQNATSLPQDFIERALNDCVIP